MAAVAQATTHTHFIYHFKHYTPPPEGTSLHDRDIQRNNIPRWMNRLKGNYTQAVQNWFVRSSDKDGQSLNNGE